MKNLLWKGSAGPQRLWPSSPDPSGFLRAAGSLTDFLRTQVTTEDQWRAERCCRLPSAKGCSSGLWRQLTILNYDNMFDELDTLQNDEHTFSIRMGLKNQKCWSDRSESYASKLISRFYQCQHVFGRLSALQNYDVKLISQRCKKLATRNQSEEEEIIQCVASFHEEKGVCTHIQTKNRAGAEPKVNKR